VIQAFAVFSIQYVADDAVEYRIYSLSLVEYALNAINAAAQSGV
jgi:hypothetical protein